MTDDTEIDILVTKEVMLARDHIEGFARDAQILTQDWPNGLVGLVVDAFNAAFAQQSMPYQLGKMPPVNVQEPSLSYLLSRVSTQNPVMPRTSHNTFTLWLDRDGHARTRREYPHTPIVINMHSATKGALVKAFSTYVFDALGIITG